MAPTTVHNRATERTEKYNLFSVSSATLWLGLRCCLAAVIAALALVGPAQAQSITDVMRDVKLQQRLNEQLPLRTPFRDETGGSVLLQDYFGQRPVVLAFVYYECPMLCSFILNGLVKGLKPVRFDPGREFDVVVISFDPREKPALAAAKKAAYVKEYGRPRTERGWHFLTGDQDSVTRVTKAAGFEYLFDPNSNQYAHASGVIVATPEGKLFRYFYGIEYAPRDLRLAFVEAAKNKIGTPVDQLLLYCFHYDPRTGKYGFLITNVIRLAGTATALALGIFLFVMFRRERQVPAIHRRETRA